MKAAKDESEPRPDANAALVPCTLRDGTVLRADVYRPRTAGRYPVLLCRTPYDKSSNLYIHDAPVLASFGYIVAVQDCRGQKPNPEPPWPRPPEQEYACLFY